MIHELNSHVAIVPLGTQPLICGKVINLRHDDRGVAIYTVYLDDPSVTPDGLYVAREWELLNEFQVAMIRLDCALTGKSAAEVARQMHHKPRTPAEWFRRGREWYLSDGGYSRVWVSDEDGHLFLGGNSLDKVKAAWPACAELVAAVEGLVGSFIYL